jgi:hypothetical protein
VSDVRRGRGLERLRILVDAYGLDEQGRELLVTALREAHDWMVTIVAEGARDGVPGFAAYWTPDAAERARRTDAWMEHNTDAIRAVLAT